MAEPGPLVGSRYRLESSLGSGSTGQVWAGVDTRLQRPVAVKAVAMPTWLPDEERASLKARVLREARASARIDHPSSVRTFDVVDEGDRVHLVMELVRAPSLTEVVTTGGPLAAPRAAALGLEVLGALGAAHRAGIVHRDVKPQNVMVLPDGAAKLADFGIASLRDDPRITSTGMILGTPSYMAPEQAQGDEVGPAADLWGLGALLYYAVEGTAPFDRGEALPTLHAVLHDPPRPAERAGPLGPVIAALLAKRPAERPSPARARAMLAEVGGVAGDPAPHRVPPAPVTPTQAPPAPAPAAPAPAPSAPARTTPSPGRPAWAWPAALAALVVVVVAGLAVLATRGDDAGPEAPTTSPAPGDDQAPPAEGSPDGVPADWVAYDDEATGYRLWRPPSWEGRDGPGNAVDFTDPATGDYLRVDWVQPPGNDPVQAWEEQSPRFGAGRSGYEELAILATTYQGQPAAVWEYVYEGQHATNLGFITDRFGFALNFQTSEDRWEHSQDVRRAFEAGFLAPS